MDESLLAHMHKVAEKARSKGISCEVYPENRKLNKQFSYAEKKSIPAGILIGREEYESGTITVKDLIERKSYEKLDIESGLEKAVSIVKNKKSEN